MTPFAPDAWVAESRRDAKDGEVGRVGYEHSKLREDLIGGVTNAVLAGVGCPVLMAH